MRAVVQRVSRASVKVDGETVGATGPGLLVLAGVAEGDTRDDAAWLVGKICGQRIFAGEGGRMARSVVEAGGGILAVSQFTLLASTCKGTKPSWHRAAPPEAAEPLFAEFVAMLEAALGRPVPTGRFGAMMEVDLVNDGPVTLVLDSKLRE